jgi:hypothetical protein
MTRQELIARLEELLEAANTTADTRPAAAVLASLIGALVEHSDIELMDVAATFSKERIRTIKNRWN